MRSGPEREVGDRGCGARRRARGTRLGRRCGACALSMRDDPDCAGRWTCSQTLSHSAIAAMTGSRKSFGCGLVNRIRLDSRYRVARAKQLAEVGPDRRREIASPRVDVLTEQRDLAHAVVREAGDLCDDVARSTALLAPADGRNDAVRALRVAAHRDLHPRLEPALPVHWEVGGEVLVRPELAPRHARTRPRRSTRRDEGSIPARRRRPRTGTGRRCALAGPPRSSRPTATTRSGRVTLARARRFRGEPRAACPASRGSCTC